MTEATEKMSKEDALKFLDRVTPYYKSVMEQQLGTQERRVVCALADMPPSRAKEITLRARMEARACSSVLTRLKKKEMVIHEGRTWRLRDPWLAQWRRVRDKGRNALVVPDEPPPWQKQPGTSLAIMLGCYLSHLHDCIDTLINQANGHVFTLSPELDEARQVHWKAEKGGL